MFQDFNSTNHPILQAIAFSLKVIIVVAALAFVWQFGISDNWRAFSATSIPPETFRAHMSFVLIITSFAFLALIAPTYTLYRYIIRRDLAEAQIKHMATHDTLTNVPNRNLFFDRLELAMASANRHREKLAVLFIDLDGFKAVNDRLGHDAGDHILKTTAKRLVGALRDSDTVARFGGDEFVAILTDVKDAAKVDAVVQKLKAEIAAETVFESKTISVGVSIGAAVYPDHSVNMDKLVCMADRSMYNDKQIEADAAVPLTQLQSVAKA
ncbi:GGDEF domain-containing protein [Magnetovibrio sp.]|uniref:GGDEF domain-containing protein n=1 Tax=Magnetovibrio sp. TaxID=2024836 RepID=UPI002F94349C